MDVLRRVSETDGPRSPELKKVLGELDELLQATLIDIGAKDERAGIKERKCYSITLCTNYLNMVRVSDRSPINLLQACVF